MTRVSIIVMEADYGRRTDLPDAAGRAEQWLRYTLRDLASWRAAGHEIVVVSSAARTTTDTWYQRQADRCVAASGSYAARLNVGAEQAEGDVLLFLRAYARLPPDALRIVCEGLENSGRTWGSFDIALTGQRDALRWVEWLANMHSRLTGTAFGEQAVFVRADLFRQVGGFAELPVLEDIDLCRRLKTKGAPLTLRDRVLVGSYALEFGGLGANVKRLVAMRLGYFMGDSPLDLYQRFYGQVAASASQVDAEYEFPGARIVLWAQAPITGAVNPRWQSELGRGPAVQLCRQLIRFSWSRIAQTGLAPAGICVSEPGCEAFFDDLCAREQQSWQQGAGAGEALSYTIQQVLKEADNVVVVTADFASLDAGYLKLALQALDDGARVVIGATEDGCCVLIGAAEPLPEELFAELPWNESEGLAQLQDRLRAADIQWVELPKRWRVEGANDLKRLRQLPGWYTYSEASDAENAEAVS